MSSNNEPTAESEELIALRIKVATLEKEKADLSRGLDDTSMFAWNSAQWCVALADRNRWLTGVDLDKAMKEGRIPTDTEIKVTNVTAWNHFEQDGTKKEFDHLFHTEDGQRNYPKLIKHFFRFLKTQIT